MSNSCESCAWLSHCGKRCWNPYYVLMSDTNYLPCDASMYACAKYENKSRTKKLEVLQGMSSSGFSN